MNVHDAIPASSDRCTFCERPAAVWHPARPEGNVVRACPDCAVQVAGAWIFQLAAAGEGTLEDEAARVRAEFEKLVAMWQDMGREPLHPLAALANWQETDA